MSSSTRAFDFFWFVARYAGGGLLSYATPRLLTALGVPLDDWVIIVAGWLSITLSSDLALWILSFAVGALLFFWPSLPERPGEKLSAAIHRAWRTISSYRVRVPWEKRPAMIEKATPPDLPRPARATTPNAERRSPGTTNEIVPVDGGVATAARGESEERLPIGYVRLIYHAIGGWADVIEKSESIKTVVIEPETLSLTEHRSFVGKFVFHAPHRPRSASLEHVSGMMLTVGPAITTVEVLESFITVRVSVGNIMFFYPPKDSLEIKILFSD